MKRSGGVTAAAVVLIFGSALFVLFAVMMVLASVLPQPTKEPNPLGPAFFYVEAGFMLALAGWGIATAVGIFRLRNWARISILVMSGIAAAMTLLSSLSMFLILPMMKQDPKMPAGAIAFVAVFEVILFAIPLAISVWWLILFSLKSVRAQFATAAQGAVLQPRAAGGMPVSAMPEAPGSSVRTIPVSLVVIAIFLLVGTLFVGFTVPFSIHRHVPFLLFGLLVTGTKAIAAVIVMGAVQLICGIALLRRKAWSLDATVAYAILATVNILFFFVSGSREAYFQLAFQSYQSPPNLPPDFFLRMMHSFMPAIMGFTVVVNLIALYFLWTRRETYRAACASK